MSNKDKVRKIRLLLKDGYGLFNRGDLLDEIKSIVRKRQKDVGNVESAFRGGIVGPQPSRRHSCHEEEVRENEYY